MSAASERRRRKEQERRDAITRALRHHHATTGAVTWFDVDEDPHTLTPFRVSVYGLSGTLELTIGEGQALAVGLAAADRRRARVSS